VEVVVLAVLGVTAYVCATLARPKWVDVILALAAVLKPGRQALPQFQRITSPYATAPPCPKVAPRYL